MNRSNAAAEHAVVACPEGLVGAGVGAGGDVLVHVGREKLLVGRRRRRCGRERAGRREDKRVGRGEERLFEGVYFLSERGILRFGAAQFGADGVNQAVAFCDVALERGDVLYNSR